MPNETCNVALVGTKFMGRAHSNAYLKAAKFFDLPAKPVMHTIVARNDEELKAFADRWGWQNSSTDFNAVINNADIDERRKQEPYKDRRVYFRALITPEGVEYTIRDQGPGFDISTIPAIGDPESFRDGIGRGLVLMMAFMDEVHFNEQGNEVFMKKVASEPPKKPR